MPDALNHFKIIFWVLMLTIIAFFSITVELERIDPVLYKTVADQVSESLLDLMFVQMETDMISLRLGQAYDRIGHS